jgi:hypothetical protein
LCRSSRFYQLYSALLHCTKAHPSDRKISSQPQFASTGREYSRLDDLRIFDATSISIRLIIIVRPPTDLGDQMIAMTKAAVRVFGSASDSEILKQIALLCGAGLLVSLLMLTYGIDLSPGLF